MATKRKPYIRIARSILHEPWPYELKAACVMLQCHMADRWATDQLSAEEACHVVLSPGDMMNITGRGRADSARVVLNKLAGRVSIEIDYRDGMCSIYWPKLAEYQGWAAREWAETRADPAPTSDQSAPSPSPSPNKEKGFTTREREDAPSAPLSPSAGGVSSSGSGPTAAKPEWVHVPAIVFALRDLPGADQAKAEWVNENLSLMGLEVLKDPKLKTNANKAAALGALAFRYYRAHVSGTTPGGRKLPGPAGEGVREREAREAEEYSRRYAEGGTP